MESKECAVLFNTILRRLKTIINNKGNVVHYYDQEIFCFLTKYIYKNVMKLIIQILYFNLAETILMKLFTV